MEKRENKAKKLYHRPQLIASERAAASNNVCGWFTQCGKQVQYRS